MLRNHNSCETTITVYLQQLLFLTRYNRFFLLKTRIMSKQIYYRDGRSHEVPEGYELCPKCIGAGEQLGETNVGGMRLTSGQYSET